MSVYTVVKTIGTASRQYSTLLGWHDGAPADLTTAEKSACTNFATAAFVVGETLNFVGSGAVGKLLETDSTGIGTGTYMVYGITSGNPATGDVITGASTATCTLTSGTTPDVGIIWQGQCYNDTPFTATTTSVTISGSTSSATCYKELTTGPGQSFVDNKNIQNTPLMFNTANGVSITNTGFYTGQAVVVTESYARVNKIQARGTQTGNGGAGAISFGNAPTGVWIDRCIAQSSGTGQYNCVIGVGGGTLSNSLAVSMVPATNILLHGGIANVNIYNVTACTISSVGATTYAYRASYSVHTHKNCAYFNVTNALYSGTGQGTPIIQNSYTSGASAFSGFTTIPFSSAGFANTTNDFRLTANSPLINAGVDDTTYSLYDIAGTKRPQDLAQKLAEAGGGRYDVGCWEYVYPANTGKVTNPNYILKPFSSQPQTSVTINYNNPLTRGLVSAILPNLKMDVVTGNLLIGTRNTKATQYGVSTDPATSTVYMEITPPIDATSSTALQYDIAGPISVFALCAQFTETNSGLTFGRYNGSSPPHYAVGLHGGSFDSPVAQLGSYSYAPAAADPLMVNKLHLVGVTGDGTTARLYYDGNLYNSGAYTPPTYVYNSTIHRTVIIGSGGTGLAANTHCYLGLIWNRTLSAEEVKSLNSNPWQLFKAKPQRVWAPAPPSGKWTLNNSNLIGSNKTKVPKVAPAGQTKVSWRVQPPAGTGVNWQHPIAKYLTLLVDGTGRDVTTGTFLSSSGSIDKAATTKGIGTGSLGTGYYSNSSTLDRRFVANNNTRFAIIGTIASRDLLQTNKYLAFLRDTGGVGNQAAVIFEYVDNTIEFYAFGYTGSNPRTGSGIIIPDTAAHTFGYSYNGSNYTGWLDGTLVFSTTRTFDLNIASTALVSSLLSANGSNTASATLLQWATFSQGMPSSVMQSLTANPWQLFAPATKPVWAPAQ